MIKISVFKYFVLAAIVPVLYTFLSGLIILAFDDTPQVSEYFSDNYSFFLWLITFYSLLAIVAFLPIFLNKKKAIAANRFLSILTWFLLPILLICFIVYDLITNQNYHSENHLFNLAFFYFDFQSKKA